MYEVDHITTLSDIPDNISNLLTELKEFKEDFSIEIEYCKNRYKIILHESSFNVGFNTTRCILMQISENPCSYSIRLFNKDIQNSGKEDLKKVYDIEVEGENDFRLIKQDVKDLIEGKKGATHSPNYPL